MASKVLSLRVEEELAAWAEEYAEARGVSKQELLAGALRSFREDCERGVPEIRARIAEQSSVNTSAEVGVGDCPERGEGLGHVWSSSREDSTRPCRFCGTLGRGRRNASGEIVEPGYFDLATQARSDLYGELGRAAAARKAAAVKARGK